MFNAQFGILPTPYLYLVEGERQQLNREWLEDLFKQYEVKILEPEESENL